MPSGVKSKPPKYFGGFLSFCFFMHGVFSAPWAMFFYFYLALYQLFIFARVEINPVTNRALKLY